MYFNEFYSDTFLNFQLKHKFKYLEISPWLKPQITLISRHAIGDMRHQERHQGISFQTLDKGYSEVGLEINRLFFGFGLSFAYRYGAYHLSQFEDNFAFKFTFNIQGGSSTTYSSEQVPAYCYPRFGYLLFKYEMGKHAVYLYRSQLTSR
jgi:hemolysin activation/secretion protein